MTALLLRRLRFLPVLLLGGLLLTQSTSASMLNRNTQDADPTEDITLSIGSTNPITFQRASIQALSRSYIKLTGVDLSDDQLIDSFSIINYCDIYAQYFGDEFSWRNAREAFRRVIQRELESYPEDIYLLGSINIGRYDFEKKAFTLSDDSKFDRTGQFRFVDRNFACGRAAVTQLPLFYTFMLTNPITLDRIPVTEQKAFNITRIMEQQQNVDRKIYVTFFLRINDFTSQRGGDGTTNTRANVRATLLSMRFYLDRQRKIMIYEYTGNN